MKIEDITNSITEKLGKENVSKIADDMATNEGLRSDSFDTGAELKAECITGTDAANWTVSDAGKVTYTGPAVTGAPAETPLWYTPAA